MKVLLFILLFPLTCFGQSALVAAPYVTTVSCTPAFSAGFNGSSNYLEATNFTGISATQFSISLWFYLNATNLSKTFFSNFTGTNNGWVIGIRDDAANKVKIYLGGSTFTSNVSLSNNTWYHVVFTYNAGSCNLYINNNSPETGSLTVNYGSTALANDIGHLTGNTQYTNGNIVCLGYWGGRELSSSDVSSLYNSGTPVEYSCMSAGLLTSLLAFYNLQETSGASRLDATGNSNTMADHNTVTQQSYP